MPSSQAPSQPPRWNGVSASPWNAPATRLNSSDGPGRTSAERTAPTVEQPTTAVHARATNHDRPIRSTTCFMASPSIENDSIQPLPLSPDFTPHVLPTQSLRELLDRVSKHRARHPAVAGPQERLGRLPVPLPHFPQHPAHGLVDEVVRVRKENVGQ